MPSTKPIALTIAVLAFFTVAILSFIAGCAPDTCCFRAVLGAAAAYCIAAWALKTIFNIVCDALTTTKHNTTQQVEYVSTDTDRQHS